MAAVMPGTTVSMNMLRKPPALQHESTNKELPGEGRYTAAQLSIVMPDDDNLGTMTDDLSGSTESSECYQRRRLSLVQSPLTPLTPGSDVCFGS